VEDLKITSGLDRLGKYKELLPQIRALVTGESDLTANLANIAAALKEAFDFLWVGFYLVKKDQLILGPFQGPVACTRINFGSGVCGTAWEEKRVLNVPDVNNFPGHITCSSQSRSEIVLPAFSDEQVFLVLDIDSDQPGYFNDTDLLYLQQVIDIIEDLTGFKNLSGLLKEQDIMDRPLK
jgi:GAF domain-containing protein